MILTGGAAANYSYSAVREPAADRTPLVIAHRGASGYLPEHTLAAKALAYGQGADYIEQDLVMTKDNKLIVLHDIHLDAVTNVRDLYPSRMREDGRFYAIDFTLDEIRSLSVVERFEWDKGMGAPVFSERFPVGLSTFRVHTLAEEIELIQGLNRSTGKDVGIYPEMKNPAFHHAEGRDIASTTLSVLKNYGYVGSSDRIFLQCFDHVELQRIHDELLPAMGMSVPLIQLLAPMELHTPLITREGLAEIAGYAIGIGPSMSMLVAPDSTPGALDVTELVRNAKSLGLKVHPYTFRRDSGQLPGYAADYEDLLDIFINDLGVDGVFTDFPDLTRDYLQSNPQ